MIQLGPAPIARFLVFVFLEIVLGAEGLPGFGVLMGEVCFPTRAEIDVPAPETSFQRLGIFVITCSKLAVFAGILCHIQCNYIVCDTNIHQVPGTASGQCVNLN